MRTTRNRARLTDWIPDPVKEFASRRAAETTGLALIAGASACAVALATWSVQDPSINHATRAPTRNLLGAPGAIVADLSIQLLGLAIIAFLLPPAVWGVRLLAARPFPNRIWRIAAWIAGFFSAAALLSSLPKVDRWPLPGGLGGAVGDVLNGFAKRAVASFYEPLVGVAPFLFAALAILFLTAAVSFGDSGAEEDSERETPGARRRPDDDLSDRDSEPGLAIIWIGAMAHALLSAKAAIGRTLAGGFAYGRARMRETMAAGAAGEATRADIAARREPTFEDHGAPVGEVEPPALEPRTIEVDYARKPAGSRVATPAPSPKSGKRIEKERQPSLLDRNDDYELPRLTFLAEPKKSAAPLMSADALEQNARLLEGVLEDFGVKGEITAVRPGPVVTLYELEPAPGTKSSRVISLADDIARSMSALSARVAVIQGKNAIGIELPNHRRETVYLREMLASQDYETSKQKLALCLGKTIGGEPVIAELARMPHLLVAGTTGSGKSVAINTMILSLVYRLTPDECRLIMVDPKMLELSVYDGIPHLLTPVVTDPKKAVVALKWAVREMEDRYKKMAKLGVRNIDGFNARVGESLAKGEQITRTVQTGFDRETGEPIFEQETMDLQKLPYIVVIVDEMADLMMVAGKEIEGAVQRLAQMARAAGIHVILATQRPSVDVITGTIKANFPTRISFQVTSKIDSRTILGEQGAEQLLGQGDMLYMAGGGRIQRVHGPFVADDEVEKVVAHLKRQAKPQYLEEVTAEDPSDDSGDSPVFDQGEFGSGGGDLYDQAIAIVLRDKKASTSYIQRRLQIGYNRAASLMERMEKEGVVGPANHAGKREILLETPQHAMADED
ncbi:MAG: cell division protein FtsK [Rhizobiales bacterium 65-9]|nr:DNA translocase FtsK [Hyphomicrobiales bacterium]OJY36581.1 MAG: cell division protein FtsK [Rhizobiales bacterium 65-9]